MTEIAVVLGRTPELSRLELEATLRRGGYRVDALTVASGVALVKVDPKPEKSWFATLGGATKFGHVLGRVEATVDAVAAVIESAPTVGLSVIGLSFDPLDLGRALKERELVRRYVLPAEGGILSAAQSKGIDHEYFILGNGNQVVVIIIDAVQDIDAFSERDRNLPVADPVRGMLPTKLARTMVNLGLGLVPTVKRPVLLDPFCGTGRVLLEAALCDAEVLGADIDPAAVNATQQNLAWAARQYHLAVEPDQVIASSIEKLPAVLSHQSIDVIVTEPTLGPPLRRQPSHQDVERIFAELESTYLVLFRAANQLLKPSGALVVVFPAIGDRSLLDLLVDRIDKFGYHPLDSIRVERPDSVVSRIITTLVRK
ncbi:methyltransferase domain-containing protein [Candidatus Berkelbacteria bacterium]|nr:methyltransferase domain-containing protein [Candidatus Berkelbacteria bacterium]